MGNSNPQIVSINLTRRGEDETPITVNWTKYATLEPIIEYGEYTGPYTEHKQIPETVGSTIVLDCGIAFEVKETPEEIDNIVRNTLTPHIYIKNINLKNKTQ